MASENKIFGDARAFIKKAGELTQSVNDAFSNLSEIEKVFNDVRKYETKDPIIDDECILLLCRDFCVLLCYAASISNTVRESTELPSRLQPKFESIKKHMDLLKKKLEEIDTTMNEIKKKIMEAEPQGYKLTKKEKFEMNMLMRALKSGLKTAEDHQKKAEQALQSLSSDNDNYAKEEAALAVDTTLQTSIAAGRFIGAAVGLLKAVVCEEDVSSASLRGSAAFGAFVGGAFGVVGATCQITSIKSRYEKRKKVIENLKNGLEDLELEVREKKRDVADQDEAVNEMMSM